MTREESIAILDGFKHNPLFNQQHFEALDMAISALSESKGEWIEKAEDYYKAINEYGGGVDENTDYFTDDIACPKCLSKFSTIDNETERFNFCPNCGADMRGEEMELKIDKQIIDQAVQKAVEELKQNNIWIPEGMTNGEVIQALFPNFRIDEMSSTVWVGYDAMSFTRKWWNAPYKADMRGDT